MIQEFTIGSHSKVDVDASLSGTYLGKAALGATHEFAPFYKRSLAKIFLQ